MGDNIRDDECYARRIAAMQSSRLQHCLREVEGGKGDNDARIVLNTRAVLGNQDVK